MSQMANNWKYTLVSIVASSTTSYNTYGAFADDYVYPHLSGTPNCLYDVNIKNNTTNDRAAQWHMGIMSNGSEVAQYGRRRTGGNFNGSYGGDIYAGAVIELRICTQIFEEHVQ